jgi:cytochrome b pre-mRNA-processing protein 3
MYILTVYLRNLETSAQYQDYQRYLIEHFSNAAEDKMLLLHNMSARGIRNRYLKDLFFQWRGILASYDEGMIKGDAVLGSAIWRNLFRGDENIDWERVALVTGYLRASVHSLAGLDMNTVITTVDGPNGIWRQARESAQRDLKRISQQDRGADLVD